VVFGPLSLSQPASANNYARGISILLNVIIIDFLMFKKDSVPTRITFMSS